MTPLREICSADYYPIDIAFGVFERETGIGDYEKFMDLIADLSNDFYKLTLNFLKSAADTGELQIIKKASDEIIKLEGDEYRERIRPIIKAVEIVETRDIRKYYDLQIEEREIVADIVRKITGSNELVPEEIKNKESS